MKGYRRNSSNDSNDLLTAIDLLLLNEGLPPKQ